MPPSAARMARRSSCFRSALGVTLRIVAASRNAPIRRVAGR
jgi:hypothetical protein